MINVREKYWVVAAQKIHLKSAFLEPSQSLFSLRALSHVFDEIFFSSKQECMTNTIQSVFLYLPVVKIKKFLRIRVPHAENPQYKKLAKLENFLKIRFFYPLVPPWGKKIAFSKSFPIWLIFCTGGFSARGTRIRRNFLILTTGRYLTRG
jgi:hypothetical protein